MGQYLLGMLVLGVGLCGAAFGSEPAVQNPEPGKSASAI
jgi:hypothetical protein